jgi:hypothetical protein
MLLLVSHKIKDMQEVIIAKEIGNKKVRSKSGRIAIVTITIEKQ